MMPFIQFTLLFVSGMLQAAPCSSLQDRVAAGHKRFNEKWRLGFSASLCYWPFVNSVMYSLVQPRFMNLYADMASLVFASIMSYITYSDCTNASLPANSTSANPIMMSPFERFAQIKEQLGDSVKAIAAFAHETEISAAASDKKPMPWLLSTQT